VSGYQGGNLKEKVLIAPIKGAVGIKMQHSKEGGLSIELLRGLVAWMIVLASVVVALAALPAPARAETGGPVEIGPGVWVTAGDWTIQNGDNVLHQDRLIYLNGNLIIEGGGVLTFENVTLQVNSTVPGEFYIEVQGGGQFYILNTGNDTIPAWDPADTDGSLVKARLPDAPYHFYVRADGLLEVTRSTVMNAGEWISPGPQPSVLEPYGVYVESDMVSVTESWLTDNAAALILNNTAAAAVVDSRVESNQVGLAALANSTLTVTGTEVINNSMLGMVINESYLSMDMSFVTGNSFSPIPFAAAPAVIFDRNATADVSNSVISNNDLAGVMSFDSDINFDLVDIADNGLVSGDPGVMLWGVGTAVFTDVDVQGNGADGIFQLQDSVMVLTRGNVSQNADDGVFAVDAHMEVYDSTFYMNGGNNGLMWVNTTPGNISAVLQGNTFIGHGNQVTINQMAQGNVDVFSDSNVLQEHAVGFQFFAPDDVTWYSRDDTVETSGSGVQGVVISGNNTTVDASGLTVDNHDTNGVFAMASAGYADVTVTNSSVSNVVDGEGIFVFASEALDAHMDQVSVDLAVMGGVNLLSGGGITADLANVDVAQATFGIGISIQSGADATATFTGGSVSGSQDAGVAVQSFGGNASFYVEGVAVSDTSGQNAVGMWTSGGVDADLTLLNSSVDGSGGAGVLVMASVGNITTAVEGTTITTTGLNVAGGGLPPVGLLVSAGGSVTDARVASNALSQLVDAGVVIFAGVDASVNFTSNTVTDLGLNPAWLPVGLYVSANAGNATVDMWDNELSDNAGGSGVSLHATAGILDVTAVNNTIASNDGLGLQAEGSELYAYLEGNRVDFNTFRGIELSSDVQGDVTLVDNRLVRSGENGLFLYTAGTMTASTTRTDVIANDLNGIYAENVALTMTDDMLVANTEAGVRAVGVDLTMDTVVAEFNVYGAVLESSSTAFIENSTLSSDTWDIFLDGASDATTLNTTFDKGKVAYGDVASWLLVEWYAKILVQTPQGQAIAGATITLEDFTGATVFSGVSDANGLASWIVVDEYWQDASSTTYYTPHNATASEASLGAGWTVATVDVSRTIVVNLVDSVAPTAVAHSDTVNEDTPVTLNSSGSFDNVGIVNYTWNFTDGGNPVVLTGAFPAYVFSQPGSYVVTLTVTDGAGNSDTATATITVDDSTPPVASAGGDQTLDAGGSVTFDGSASSDNVAIVSYTWSFYVGGSLVTLPGINPSHTFDEPGVYVVTLLVEDAAGNTATDVVIVTVNDATAPAVEDTFPEPDEEGVGTNAAIVIVFSESMDPASTEAAVSMDVAYSVAWRSDNRVMVLTPTSPLDEGTTYTVTISGTAEDAAGNPLGAPYAFSFTTVAPGGAVTTLTGLPEWIWLVIVLILLVLLAASLLLRGRKGGPEEEPPEEMFEEAPAREGEELEEAEELPPPPLDEYEEGELPEF
jgi:PKD repeat protein